MDCPNCERRNDCPMFRLVCIIAASSSTLAEQVNALAQVAGLEPKPDIAPRPQPVPLAESAGR